MKLVTLTVLSLLFACSLAVQASDRAQGGEKEEVYGAKSAVSIAVRISGGGIRKPGLYHVPAGAVLHDLLERSVWLRSSSGVFDVSRIVEGVKITIEADQDHWDLPLIEGDEVCAGTMRKEDRPNKRPERSAGAASSSPSEPPPGVAHP